MIRDLMLGCRTVTYHFAEHSLFFSSMVPQSAFCNRGLKVYDRYLENIYECIINC